MSDFVPNNRHLRELLIFFFHSKKTSVEAHRELQKVYRDAALSETTCRDWFRRYEDGDFIFDDRPREGRPKTFQDAELEALLDEDPCQTQFITATQREESHGDERNHHWGTVSNAIDAFEPRAVRKTPTT